MARLRPVGYQDRLSIVEHLDELRTRLIWCIVAFILAFSVCYWQNGWILHTMNKPLRDAQQGSGKKHSTLQEQARFNVLAGNAFRLTAPALQALGKDLNRLAAAPGVSAADRAAIAQRAAALERAAKAQQNAFAAVPKNTGRQPVTLGVTEPFVTTFTVAGYAALLLCLPFLLYQAYAFVLPAFSPEERNVAMPLMLLVMAPLVVLFELSVLLARIFEHRRRAAEAAAEDDDEPPHLGGGWDAANDDVTVS